MRGKGFIVCVLISLMFLFTVKVLKEDEITE